MTKKKMLYEGKAKTIFEGPTANTVIQYFKDDATANNAEKAFYYKWKRRAK